MTPTLPDGREITCCNVPKRMRADEAAIYQTIRKQHCARKEQPHECSGRMTIDKNGLTLSCPRCGDTRQLNPENLDVQSEVKAFRSRRDR